MKETIQKLVIKAGDVCSEHGFSLSTNENLVSCPDCLSHLVYIKINWGIVAEDYSYMVQFNRGRRVYAIRELGFDLYCAECGEFIENYNKFFYPENKIVLWDFPLNELDEEDRAEIRSCLTQFNQTGKFTSRYKDTTLNLVKQKLIEYEKKYPMKSDNLNKTGRKNDKRKTTKRKNN